MLIIRSRYRSPIAERSFPIVSIFWSQGLLCQVVRSRDATYLWSWSLYVRLWAGHPGLSQARPLQLVVDRWSRQAAEVRAMGAIRRNVSVDGLWVVVVAQDPQIRLEASHIREPEQYWYKEDLPQRDRKHYKLAAVYMESMGCHLCEILNSSP